MSTKGKGGKKSNELQVEYKVVSETEGDLWMSPKNYSIAHCVAEDLRMGAGIAVGFKQNFKGVDDLEGQKKRVGHVAILEDEERFVYYLVTKKVSNGKPTYDDLCACLREMREHCISRGVTNVAMPRIGCGLDRLEWKKVKPSIEEIFTGSGVSITVYNFQQGYGKHDPLSPRNAEVEDNVSSTLAALRINRNQEKKAQMKEKKLHKKTREK